MRDSASSAPDDVLPPERRAEALRRLHAIEREEGVRVLFACESGSRAWGFASADSDFDVRFVYARPPADLLRLDPPRDVIERPIEDDMDVSGWELRKALRLLRASNPPLAEWADSPLVYRADPVFHVAFRDAVARWYDPARARHHYRSMALGTVRAHLTGEAVQAKKYLYALRPLLAVRWIDAVAGERVVRPVPMRFDALVAAMLPESDVRAAVETLVARKRQGLEADVEPRDAVLHPWIDAELARLGDGPRRPSLPTPDAPDLDALHLDTLRRHVGAL